MQEKHQWEDPPGQELQAYDADAAAAQLGIQPGVDYYALLEVKRDADAATIKRQYYILARKWHPGGQELRGQGRAARVLCWLDVCGLGVQVRCRKQHRVHGYQNHVGVNDWFEQWAVLAMLYTKRSGLGGVCGSLQPCLWHRGPMGAGADALLHAAAPFTGKPRPAACQQQMSAAPVARPVQPCGRSLVSMTCLTMYFC